MTPRAKYEALIAELKIIAKARGLYLAEGTVMHEVASWALEADNDADAYIGRIVEVDGQAHEFDADMAAIVQVYLDTAREATSCTTVPSARCLSNPQPHQQQATGAEP